MEAENGARYDQASTPSCGGRGVDVVLTQLGLERNEKTVAAVQQAVDLNLFRANSRDDPGTICVTYDAIRLVEKR